MQAKHFIALLASTALVNAVPNLAKRRGGEPTCSNSSETPKCCESLVPQVVNGIAVQVGVGCVDVISGTCAEQAACCSEENDGVSVLQVCQLL